MIAQLLNVFFPQSCLGCRKEGVPACEDCLALLSIAPHASPLSSRSHLSALFCAVSYEDYFAKQLIHAFKYQPFIKELAKPLAFLIVSHFTLVNNISSPPQAIVPVPLHKKRLKWRGYNHATELANQLGYAFSLPVFPNMLARRIYTSPQVTLNKKQRLQNMRGVFQVRESDLIQGKTILLVDDLYTTGSTMEECARCLKKAGAKTVYGAAVARG